MIRAIFFDLDGTLFSRLPAWLRCVEDFLDRRAREIAWKRRARLVNETMRLASDATFDRQRLGRHLGLEVPELGMGPDAIAAELVRHLPEFIEPDPEVLEVLAELSERCQLAIITNGSRSVQQAKIDRAGLANAVGRVFISGPLGVRKPNPAIFRAALTWAWVEPGEALMVGDDLREDIRGAWEAGLRTCLVGDTTGRGRWAPDLAIGDLTDLPELLATGALA